MIYSNDVLGCPGSSFRFFWNLLYMKDHTGKFFAQKPKRLWNDGIFKLPERRRKLVEQNDTYIIQ